jgi:hypothetical protein
LVDLDGDGVNDLLSGSWPGELFFFRGKGKGDFEPPVKLKGQNGKSINIGGGLRKDPDGSVTVAGDAKFEKKDGKQFIVYEGEWIEVVGGGGGITGTASAVHATDWDGDGDHDLVVGDIRGNVYLVANEGTAKQWSFAKEKQLESADGSKLTVSGGDAGPFVADWDGDGKRDLLVGAGDGSAWLYRNTADKGTQLARGRQLVPAVGELYGENMPSEPTRGMRSKVCAADWNGDGRLDLLVGDITYQKPSLPPPTAEEKAEQDKIRAELAPLEKRYGEVVQRYFASRGKNDMTAEEREKLGKELGEVSQAASALRQKLPPEYENHGWVWLFLRKDVAQDAEVASDKSSP